MTTDTHTTAEEFCSILVELGWVVGQISHSTNRYGERSSYFELGGCRIRVSDHDSNTAQKFGEITILIDDATRERAVALVDEIADIKADAEARRAEEIAARDEMEAPHKAAYLATDKQHVRGDIIAKLYPCMGRMDRQNVARRWRGK